ncbi:MAG: hypothetical protein VX670_07745 [Candidatus Latescibacterota bacterium]|nr:hypothetical protein [Candidatus Latescibacterota bacterium]
MGDFGTAPVNAERLRLLSLAEKQADGHPSTSAILHAFLAPALRMYARDKDDAKHIISLLGRLHTEPRRRYAEYCIRRSV